MLILTTFDLDEYVFAALQAGASGFLLKDTHRPTCSPASGVVAGGDALLSPGITRRLIEAFASGRPGPGSRRPGSLDVLTERERDVLALVATGSPTPRSPRGSMSAPPRSRPTSPRILTKLDARDRAQLIVMAYETRLVRPGET